MAISKNKIQQMDKLVQHGQKVKATVNALPTQEPQQKVPGFLRKGLPIAGAIGGGFAGAGLGTLLGLPAGPGAAATGYAGGIGGAGLGAAGGQAAVNLLERLLGGKPPRTARENLETLIKEGKSGAASQAIGVPIAKGLGYAAHPIAPLLERVNTILRKSPKMVDVGEVLSKYKANVLPQFAKQGVSGAATEEFKKLAPDVMSAVHEFRTPNPNRITEQIPIAGANELKRNIGASVGKYYGEATDKIGVESRKQFNRLLKETIEQLEPGVKVPNAVASWLYKTPNFLESLTNIVPNTKTQLLLRRLGSLPFKAAQTVIPQGGGYLKQTIPRLLQLSSQQGE